MRLVGQVVNNNFCRFIRFVSDLLRQFYDIFTGQELRHSEGVRVRVRVQTKQRGRVRGRMRALGLFELLFINRHARTIKCISLELGLTKGPWACRVCVCVSFAFGRDNDDE